MQLLFVAAVVAAFLASGTVAPHASATTGLRTVQTLDATPAPAPTPAPNGVGELGPPGHH